MGAQLKNHWYRSFCLGIWLAGCQSQFSVDSSSSTSKRTDPADSVSTRSETTAENQTNNGDSKDEETPVGQTIIAPSKATNLVIAADLADGPASYFDDDTNSIVFRWAPSVDTDSGIRDYTVDWFAQEGCNGSGTKVEGITGQSFELKQGLASGSTYSFRVISYNNAAASAQSDCSGSITLDVTAPNAPAILKTAADSAEGDDTRSDNDINEIWFTWSAAADAESGIKSYVLHWYAAADCTGTATEVDEVSQTNYKLASGLTNSSIYSFQVFAVNQADIHGPASACSGNISAAAPSVSLDDLTINRIEVDLQKTTLSWAAASHMTADAGALRYKVYHSASNNMATLADTLTNGTLGVEVTGLTTASVSGLPANNERYFNVVVEDPAGNQTVYTQRGPYCGGLGTAIAPFDICDSGSLQNMLLHPTSQYKLSKSIDLSDSITWNNGLGFFPVGTQASPFTGVLDGDGFTLTGFTIDRPAATEVGIFAWISDGFIAKNLKLNAVNVKATNSSAATGVVAGTTLTQAGVFPGVVFTNIEVSGTVAGEGFGTGGILGVGYTNYIFMTDNTVALDVIGKGYTGGMAGSMDGYGSCGSCVFRNNRGSGTITGEGCVGGLIGCSYFLKVEDCSFTGDVTGTDAMIGGLVGGQYGSSDRIYNSWFQGNVVGDDMVGGLVGENEGRIENSFAKGTVTANSDVGGIVGNYSGGGGITNVYALNVVSGTTNVGGISGSSGTNLFNSFWDPATSGQNRGIGTNATEETAGAYEKRTSAELELPGTFPAWDFSNNWMFPTAGGTPVILGPIPTCTTVPGVTMTDGSSRYAGAHNWNPATKELTISITRDSSLAAGTLSLYQNLTALISSANPTFGHNTFSNPTNNYGYTFDGVKTHTWSGPPPHLATVEVTYQLVDVRHRTRYRFIASGSGSIVFEIILNCQ